MVIKNEKKITDVEEIKLLPDCKLIIEFKKSGASKSLFQNPQDSFVRQYICASANQRCEIIQEIYRVSFMLKSSVYPLEYKIKKIKKYKLGETLRRVYKFTTDSILSLDGSTVKKEIPYSSLLSVKRKP